MSNQFLRNTCILYLTATCNLNCTYCYIDKSPILQEIDKLLIDCYKTNYFFEFMKEMFPDPEQLIRIEFWGGEPSYGLPRVKQTIIDAINYYPNLSTFFMSTNLTTDTWLDDFTNFIQIFKLFPERHFELRV